MSELKKERFLLFLADSELEWMAGPHYESEADAAWWANWMMRNHAAEFAQRYRIERVTVESTIEGAFVGTGPIVETEATTSEEIPL